MKAIFLDRDGVLNELIYYGEHGLIDSPSNVEQFSLLPEVGKSIKRFRDLGYRTILISNQPGIGKGNMSERTFDRIRGKMKDDLAKDGALLDGEYYCLHHPEAKLERFRADCECRKPRPGLLLQAAQDLEINLSQSWMIGDGLTDVQAGKAAGCRTLLLGRMKCELCQIMDEENARPDAIVPNLAEAAEYISRQGQH